MWVCFPGTNNLSHGIKIWLSKRIYNRNIVEMNVSDRMKRLLFIAFIRNVVCSSYRIRVSQNWIDSNYQQTRSDKKVPHHHPETLSCCLHCLLAHGEKPLISKCQFQKRDKRLRLGYSQIIVIDSPGLASPTTALSHNSQKKCIKTGPKLLMLQSKCVYLKRALSF